MAIRSLFVASLPSTGTTLRTSFIPSLPTISTQSAPGTAKTTSNALLQVLTARDTYAGPTTRSLPAQQDSSAPYSALPKEVISFRTGEGNSAKQSKNYRSNDPPLSDARPRQIARPRTTCRPQKAKPSSIFLCRINCLGFVVCPSPAYQPT